MGNKLQDPIFGELIWDEKYHWWKGEARIAPDMRFDVYLYEYPKDASEDIATYHRFFELLRQNEAAAREYAAGELLDNYNDNWSGDDPPISKEEFCRRMKPESIGFFDEKEADFHYGGDLFGEHTIIVALNDEGVFTYADFEG